MFFLGKNRCETDLCSNKIGGDGYKHHLKIFSAGGFTKWGANFRISEGVLLWTAESRFSTGGDGHKHHLKNISVGGFTLGGLNVRIYRRTFSFGNLIFRNPGGEGLQIGP